MLVRLFALLCLFSLPAFAADSEFHGYMRAGSGTNGKGAKRECFYNRGSQGNEFRLGNECSVYGEAIFLAHVLKPENDKPWFNTQLRLAYFPPGNSSYEGNDASGNNAINIVEAFVEAGNIDGSPLTYWAGKRFYRDVDVHMDDWYYYAQMAGNGGGVDNIPLGNGKLALAYLVEAGSTRTNVGLNAVQVGDVRWHDVAVGANDSLNFWGAYAYAPGGQSTYTSTTALDPTPTYTQYTSRQGWLLGERWRHNIQDGFNDFSVMYGSRLLESISLYGNSAFAQTMAGPPNAYRVRGVEHLSWQPIRKFGFHFASIYEYWNPNGSPDTSGHWWDVGARPVYFFTDHWQLAFEAGHSEVQNHGEYTASGAPVGVRKLNRLTLAPQLGLGPDLWARPVLRVYYSYSFWNKANQPYVAVDAPSFAGATSGQAIGVQTEVWF